MRVTPWLPCTLYLTLLRCSHGSNVRASSLSEEDLEAWLGATLPVSLPSAYDDARASLSSSLQETMRLMDETESFRSRRIRHVDSEIPHVESLVRQQNALALQALADRISAIEALELKRRDNVMAAAHITERRQQQSQATPHMTEPQKLRLQELLSPDAILQESEERLMDWCTQRIMETLDEAQANATRAVALQRSNEQQQQVAAESQACRRLDEVASTVLQHVVAFSRDGIGLYDYALEGTIVHQYTSETYAPPPTHRITWGSLGLDRLVPQDWEQWLPQGWRDWSIHLPTDLTHALGWTRGYGAAPPETILQPTVLPGSCWPMAGSAGSVMIRLASPVQITAVSIEHAPPTLLDHYGHEAYSTAPKTLRVYGLRPCHSGCGGLGLDRSHPVLLATLELDARAGSVLTVPVQTRVTDEGSCAALAGTCTAPPAQDEDHAGPWGGVVWEVLDNHGNDAYTCIYRVRVHGHVQSDTDSTSIEN